MYANIFERNMFSFSAMDQTQGLPHGRKHPTTELHPISESSIFHQSERYVSCVNALVFHTKSIKVSLKFSCHVCNWFSWFCSRNVETILHHKCNRKCCFYVATFPANERKLLAGSIFLIRLIKSCFVLKVLFKFN
jgi:hypothetical protein